MRERRQLDRGSIGRADGDDDKNVHVAEEKNATLLVGSDRLNCRRQAARVDRSAGCWPAGECSGCSLSVDICERPLVTARARANRGAGFAVR